MVQRCDLVKSTMFDLNQNNTLFHLVIVSRFEQIIDYISTIPGNFKEQYVKYRGNLEDHTIIIFDSYELTDIETTINRARDFITSYYY